MWRRLGQNASLSLLSLVAVAVFGFGAMYFNARALGVEGLGAYATVLALSLFLEAVAGMQCWQAILALSKGRERTIFGAALALNLMNAAIAVIVGITVVLIFELPGGWFTIVHMVTLLVRLTDPLIGILRQHDRFGFVAAVRSGIALSSFALASLFWAIEASLAIYILSAAAVQVAQSVILATAALRVCSPAKPTAHEMKEVLRFSVPTGASGVIGNIRARGIVLLLGAFSGTASVGLYTVADRISGVMQMAYRAVFEAVFREMPEVQRPGQLAAIIGVGGFAVGAAAVAGVVLLGEFVIRLVAGSAFSDAYLPLLILVAAIGATLVTLGLRAWIIVFVSPSAMLKCNGVALLSLLSAPWLIDAYGAVGAAWTQILFEVIWTLAALFVLLTNLRPRGDSRAET